MTASKIQNDLLTDWWNTAEGLKVGMRNYKYAQRQDVASVRLLKNGN